MAAPVRALPWKAGMVSTQPMTWINDLRRLQETDTALDSRRGSLADAEARLGETEELIDAACARARTCSRAAASRVDDQKDVELEADDLKSKIAPAETKLYSGAIKNPKELADLQADIDQLKRHLSAVEDRDLEALTRLEAAENAHTAAAAELAALEAAWAEEQAELAERIKMLTAEIAEYDAQRGEAGGGDRAGACCAPTTTSGSRTRAGRSRSSTGTSARVPHLAADEHREQGESRERARAVPELRAHPACVTYEGHRLLPRIRAARRIARPAEQGVPGVLRARGLRGRRHVRRCRQQQRPRAGLPPACRVPARTRTRASSSSSSRASRRWAATCATPRGASSRSKASARRSRR